jgi:hypothetical protein
MRAKEYIAHHLGELKYIYEIRVVINNLLPLRSNKKKTDECANRMLYADQRRKQYLYMKELYEQGNPMAKEEPKLETYDGEIDKDIANEVRAELFDVIREDMSFGYLFYLLGTERNTKYVNSPIDCIPDEKKIKEAITRYRDDYPKVNLDDYLDDSLNYEWYNNLINLNVLQDEPQECLQYFNMVYQVYDEIRMRTQRISLIKSYLNDTKFKNDIEKYWVLTFIVRLIDEYESDNASLDKCKKEILKFIAPLNNAIGHKNEYSSPISLSTERGKKIDLIRVVNSLYELGFFVSASGGKAKKKDTFNAIGKALNIDLNNYDKDLSRSLSDSTALDKHLHVFEEMGDKMEEIFNSK